MPQDKVKYGITDKQADEWLKNNPVDTKHGGYIRRDTIREMMMNSQSMKPIIVTPKEENAQAKQEDFNWDEIKKSMGEGEVKLMEKPLYDGTPPQVDKIGTAPPSTGKPTIATPMIATPMTPDETSFYQERLNDLGF